MEITLTLHKASEVLPEKSGAYLVRTSDVFNCWQVLGYSVKYRKFNTYDSLDNDDNAIAGDLWAELPEVEE